MFNERLIIIENLLHATNLNLLEYLLLISFVAEKQQGVRVVDKLLVEFGNRMPPLSLNVTDTKVKRIKFEVRLINKVKLSQSMIYWLNLNTFL